MEKIRDFAASESQIKTAIRLLSKASRRAFGFPLRNGGADLRVTLEPMTRQELASFIRELRNVA